MGICWDNTGAQSTKIAATVSTWWCTLYHTVRERPGTGNTSQSTSETSPLLLLPRQGKPITDIRIRRMRVTGICDHGSSVRGNCYMYCIWIQMRWLTKRHRYTNEIRTMLNKSKALDKTYGPVWWVWVKTDLRRETAKRCKAYLCIYYLYITISY